MSKIYLIRQDFSTSYFLCNEINSNKYNGVDLDEKIENNYLLTHHSEHNVNLNYKFDLSELSNFLVFSENAVTALSSIIENDGKVFPVTTGSKRKNFFGFYPSNAILNSTEFIDPVLSEFNDDFYSIAYFNSNILKQNHDIFVVNGIRNSFFVSERFKKIVEDNGLLGFKFDIFYDSSIDELWRYELIKKHWYDEGVNPLFSEFFECQNPNDLDKIDFPKKIINEYPFYKYNQEIKKSFSERGVDDFYKEYENLCLNNKDIDDFSNRLNNFSSWCIRNGMKRKHRYVYLSPPSISKKRNYS